MASKLECMICDDAIIKENPIYVCVKCDIKVHKFCYGIQEPLDNWKCSPCSHNVEKKDRIKCQLCPNKGGVMKRTKSGKWVHVICSLFMPGVTFSNPDKMEPVDISMVPAMNKNKTCSFCNTSNGACTTCTTKGCKVKFHISCAQKEKTLKEELVDENKIDFNAYCKEHNPTGSSRRLSSESVAHKKRERTSTADPSEKDGTWILNTISNHSTPLPTKRKSKYCLYERIQQYSHNLMYEKKY